VIYCVPVLAIIEEWKGYKLSVVVKLEVLVEPECGQKPLPALVRCLCSHTYLSRSLKTASHPSACACNRRPRGCWWDPCRDRPPKKEPDSQPGLPQKS